MRTDKLKKEVGKRIRAERERLGWTQEVLAKKVATTNSSISKYETGVILPPIESLIELGRVLHISIDYLLFGKEKQIDEISDEGSKILADLENIPFTKRQRLYKIFREIIQLDD